MDYESHYDISGQCISDEDDFDMMMDDALSRLNIMVNSPSSTNVINPTQLYNMDCNTVSHTSIDCIDDDNKQDNDSDCEYDETHKVANLTQIYRYDENNTTSICSSNDEYDEYDEYDSDDEVYENVEYSYHAEKMDKKTGNFGRI